MVGNKGGKQDRLSPRQKTDRLLFLIRCRLTGWIWISFQPWTEKQVSQKDHLVALGSVGVYSSLVCLHSFHILHILPSKCVAICRPPFSLCSTVEQKKSKKAKYKKEPLKCSRWDFHCISIGFIRRPQDQFIHFYTVVKVTLQIIVIYVNLCSVPPSPPSLFWLKPVPLVINITTNTVT